MLNPFERAAPFRVKPGLETPPDVRILLIDAAGNPLCGRADGDILPQSFKGLAGERIELTGAANAPAGRTIAIGCGAANDAAGEPTFWEAIGASIHDALQAFKIEEAQLAGRLQPTRGAADHALRSLVLGAVLASYRCHAYRSTPPKGNFDVQQLFVPAASETQLVELQKLPDAINWARALVDAPANHLTPASFCNSVHALQAIGIEVEVLDVAALERIGAGGLLAVGRGSEHPPCLLVCRWRGCSSDQTDLALVGKGMTFDGGGLNLKARPVIEKMKFDMAGAAAVIAALRALAEDKTALNVVAAIPLAENSIDANSYRPGDVIRSLAGLTIEVLDTDAEGRIVMADAMTYLISHFTPRYLIDLATLTGSMLLALHEEFAGLFSADEELVARLEACGRVCGDELWRMPLSVRHDYLVESEIADVRNLAAPGFLGVASGSAIGGAKFLQKFSGGTRWAHIDIAGVAWSTRPRPGIAKGATGFGVRLLVELAAGLSRLNVG